MFVPLQQAGLGVGAARSGKARVVQPCGLLHPLMVVILGSASVPVTAHFPDQQKALLRQLFSILVPTEVCKYPSFLFLGYVTSC